jgi:periplasmic protein TonB
VKPRRAARRFWVGLALSGVLHGALALLLAQVEPEAPCRRPPLLIDFTLDPAPGPPPRAGGPASASEPARARPVRTHQARRDPLVPPLVEPTPAAPLAEGEVEDAVSESPSEGAEDGGVAVGSGEGSGEAKGGIAGGVEGGSGGVEAASAEYNRAHFEYLRREIHQRLVYPEVAREMGWEGRVLLSFLVAQDGSVREVAVTESSGIALLDKSAVTTVHRAAPLPKPPCDVRVVMPIAYVLR